MKLERNLKEIEKRRKKEISWCLFQSIFAFIFGSFGYITKEVRFIFPVVLLLFFALTNYLDINHWSLVYRIESNKKGTKRK